LPGPVVRPVSGRPQAQPRSGVRMQPRAQALSKASRDAGALKGVRKATAGLKVYPTIRLRA
jgi:hypothetical protein